MRAGELLALTIADLDFFDQRTIRVNKSADDNTREIRQPKTKSSVALLPMPTVLADMLRNYLLHLDAEPQGYFVRDPQRFAPALPRQYGQGLCLEAGAPQTWVFLQPAQGYTRFATVCKATELAEASVPITVLQNQ